MTKNTYILAVMLCSILCYGQQITFHENVNYKANVLQQSLDSTGNYLLLESKDHLISQVDIFNDDFSQSIHIQNNKTKISLKALPIGNFVIQAKIDKKWIIMYLEKNEELKITSSQPNQKNIDIKALASQRIINKAENVKNEDLKIISSNQKEKHNDKKALASQQKSNNVKNYDSTFYWVVSESNSGFGSSRSMRLEYKDDIEKLIYKDKLELKSDVGKNNMLLVYEVYDRSKFMTKQLRNSGYYQSETSEFFNVVPIYASRNLKNSLNPSTTVYADENDTN